MSQGRLLTHSSAISSLYWLFLRTLRSGCTMPLYLITGASGFLGYHLVRQLVEDGADVKILDLNPPGSSRTIGPLHRQRC